MTAIPFNLSGFFAGHLGGGLGNAVPGRKAFADIIAQPRSTPRATAVDRRNDEKLLQAHQRGDREAFATLMDRYANELLHFLIRFLGSRAAADDVFQETFLQVHLSADTFDLSRRFKPWLFTIAANKARDYYRKHNRNAAASLSASIDAEDEGERFVDLLESPEQQPQVPLLDAERSRLVKKVIDSLPLHLREILLLSYFQRLSYNQIADSLEIPLGTVKSRLHSAVGAFARAWTAERGADDTGKKRNDEFSERRTDGNAA